jgi:hypothetical protein
MKKLLLLLSLPLVLFGCSKDRNLDGSITISDIWISFQEFAILVGLYVKSFLNIFTNNSVGRFFEIDVINWESNTYLYVGIGLTLLVLLSIIIWILDTTESFIWNLQRRQLRKEEKEIENKRIQEILKKQEENKEKD